MYNSNGDATNGKYYMLNNDIAWSYKHDYFAIRYKAKHKSLKKTFSAK